MVVGGVGLRVAGFVFIGALRSYKLKDKLMKSYDHTDEHSSVICTQNNWEHQGSLSSEFT